jgi:hypothetical protein
VPWGSSTPFKVFTPLAPQPAAPPPPDTVVCLATVPLAVTIHDLLLIFVFDLIHLYIVSSRMPACMYKLSWRSALTGDIIPA